MFSLIRRTHVAAGNRQDRRKHKEDRGKANVRQRDNVRGPAKPAGQDPFPLGQLAAALEAVDRDGEAVGEVEGDDGGGDDGVEGAVGTVSRRRGAWDVCVRRNLGTLRSRGR
jgi:hypothetical protein